jgi:hypothetical protein
MDDVSGESALHGTVCSAAELNPPSFLKTIKEGKEHEKSKINRIPYV